MNEIEQGFAIDADAAVVLLERILHRVHDGFLRRVLRSDVLRESRVEVWDRYSGRQQLQRRKSGKTDLPDRHREEPRMKDGSGAVADGMKLRIAIVNSSVIDGFF